MVWLRPSCARDAVPVYSGSVILCGRSAKGLSIGCRDAGEGHGGGRGYGVGGSRPSKCLFSSLILSEDLEYDFLKLFLCPFCAKTFLSLWIYRYFSPFSFAFFLFVNFVFRAYEMNGLCEGLAAVNSVFNPRLSINFGFQVICMYQSHRDKYWEPLTRTGFAKIDNCRYQ